MYTAHDHECVCHIKGKIMICLCQKRSMRPTCAVIFSLVNVQPFNLPAKKRQLEKGITIKAVRLYVSPMLNKLCMLYLMLSLRAAGRRQVSRQRVGPYYEGESANVSYLIENLMMGYDKRLRPNYKGKYRTKKKLNTLFECNVQKRWLPSDSVDTVYQLSQMSSGACQDF